MKNKSAVVFVLGLVGLFSGMAYGAAAVRGAKGVVSIPLSTTANIVSKTPAVVYSVILGTGAVTDFVVLFDSANATAANSALQTTAAGYRGRYYSTATANAQITFDPPLQFVNGITAMNATAGMSSLIVYEPGRVTQGN